MTEKDLNRYTDQEASALKYYGLRELREKDKFDDAKFYDRLISIGYTKKVLPLPLRCAAGYVSNKNKPVLECTVEELEYGSGPRNHDENVYTPLEYVLATKYGNYEELIKILLS